MILQIIPREGIGRGRPITIEAAQVVVLNDQGTPIAAAAHYGPNAGCAVASVAHDEAGFQRMLRVLGINTTVIVNKLVMPQPEPNARLLHSPQ